jgi:hypothetical protein
MKNALTAWKWSLGVVARSPMALGALAIALAAEFYAAYRWLYFPMESATYLMVIGLLWALLMFAVLAGLVAVSAASAFDVAATGARTIDARSLVRFSRTGWLRAAAWIVLAVAISAKVYYLFSWINSYSLEVASWLTFQSEKPVAQETAEAVLIWVERFLWIVVAGFLVGFLVALARDGWRAALRAVPRLLADACWRAPLLTGLVSIFAFGGIAYLLFTWNPTVPPGFLDYAQFILRNGLGLAFTVAGWIFWILALTRHSAPIVGGPVSTPDAK